MSSFAVFNIDSIRHTMKEVLDAIHEMGYKTQRTKRLDFSEEEKDVGYQILETDITLGDPIKSVVYRGQPTIICVFLPHPGTGLQKYDKDINRKLYNKLKRKFEASF